MAAPVINTPPHLEHRMSLSARRTCALLRTNC
jgi:hypothetical protein